MNGYRRVSLQNGASRRKVLVHRLVLEAFVGPCPEGQECAHLNGNRVDNRIENLRWCGRKENCSHKALHGTRLAGEQCRLAKLTSKKVAEIRSLQGKMTQGDIAAKFHVDRITVYRIQTGRLWT